MKLLKLFGILLLALVAMTGTAMAADYAVTSLEVNGEAPSGSLHVEPGAKIVVHANVKGLSADEKDVKMRVWLGGYEYGDVQATTSMFKVSQDVTYSKYLVLELPDDLNTGSNEYTLHVDVFGANDVVERYFSLYVEESRHNLQIMDVILVPGSDVDAGDMVYAKVRVENMGYKKEEDIKVEVSIPELGAYAKTYIDELNPRNEDDNSESSNTLYMKVPKDAETGDYELNVKVVYDRGHTSIQQTKMVHVEGRMSEEKVDARSLVSIEDGAKELKAGKEAKYQVLVANIGDMTGVYTVEVVGAKAWAEVRVDPAVATVMKKETAEFVVSVVPEEDGKHSFTIKVKEEDAVVAEKNVTVNVEKASKLEGVSPYWLVAGAVLVVIVVLVVLSQMQGDKVTKDDLEEDAYYQPRQPQY